MHVVRRPCVTPRGFVNGDGRRDRAGFYSFQPTVNTQIRPPERRLQRSLDRIQEFVEDLQELGGTFFLRQVTTCPNDS